MKGEVMQWEKAGGSDAPKGEGGKKRGILIGVAVVVLLVVLVRMVGCGGSRADSISWPSSGLATMLPEPKSPKGTLWENSDKEFSVSLEELDAKTQSEYIESCKEKGFTVDAVSETSSYVAYNDEGYKLDLSFISDESLSIDLTAPVKMDKIAWPTAGPAAQVPAPSSLKGKIENDRDDYFSVKIGSMDEAAFSAYAAQCRDAGFNVDYSMGDKLFTAKNAAGYSVRIEYQGNKIVEISVNAPSGTVAEGSATDAPAASEAPATSEEPAATSGNDTSFRAWVDEYEQFMNEYVDFMVEYANSGNAASMALDYAKWVARYGEMTSKASEVDDSQLSAEDAQYFLEAQTRVNQRLLEIA